MDELISRQAALRTDCFGDGHDGLRAFHVYEDYKKMRDYIESLPSVQPERKRGKWEFIGGYGYQYRCSACIMCAEHKTNFCPNCGADMRGESNA